MIESLSKKFKSAALKILDLDDTSLPREQFDLIKDCAQRTVKFNMEIPNLDDLVKMLRKKHSVESIIVSNGNGSAIASSNGAGIKQALSKTALFNYINSELPKSEAVLIKSKQWHMLLAFKDKIYIVNAASDLTQLELKAIAREVEEYLSKQQGF